VDFFSKTPPIFAEGIKRERLSKKGRGKMEKNAILVRHSKLLFEIV
jgi:hypothetical protein